MTKKSTKEKDVIDQILDQLDLHGMNNHMLKISLALLHHNDIYCTVKEDNFEKLKLKQKLTGYKLSALIHYLPQ